MLNAVSALFALILNVYYRLKAHWCVQQHPSTSASRSEAKTQNYGFDVCRFYQVTPKPPVLKGI